MVKELKEEDFNELKKEGLVLVDMYATWCGPCKMFSPIIDEVAKELDLNVIKVDTDEHEDLAEEYGIMSIPTILLFKDGELVKKNVGLLNKSSLKDFVKDA